MERLVFAKLLSFAVIPARYPFLVLGQDFAGFVGPNSIHEVAAVGQVLSTGVRKDRAVKDSVQGVVVGGRDRIELVVVAAGALDAQAEECLAKVVDRVLERDVAQAVRADANAARNGQIAGGHQVVPSLWLAVPWQEIACDLLADEFVVGLVGLECVDDVVAVLVSFRDGKISRIASRVGIAHQVQPVATPTFAVAWRL